MSLVTRFIRVSLFHTATATVAPSSVRFIRTGVPTCRYLQPNRVCAFEFQTVVSSIDSVTTHLLHYILLLLLLLGSGEHLPSTTKKTRRCPREMMKHRRLTQSFTEFVIDSLETNSECNAEQQRDPTRPDRLVSTIVRSWRRRRRYKYSNLCTVPGCHPRSPFDRGNGASGWTNLHRPVAICWGIEKNIIDPYNRHSNCERSRMTFGLG